jgi:hypothetical protein
MVGLVRFLFVSEAAVIAIFNFLHQDYTAPCEKWRRVQRIGLKDMRHFLDLNLNTFPLSKRRGQPTRILNKHRRFLTATACSIKSWMSVGNP